MAKKTSHSARGKKIQLAKVATPPCKDFFLSWARINAFFGFVLGLGGALQSISRLLEEGLIEEAPNQETTQELRAISAIGDGVLDDFMKHIQFFLETMLVRHVENYLNYLSGLLFEIFTQRPETLRSSESLDAAMVFSHASMDDLIRTQAQRRVESMSYRSFQDLAAYFTDRFGLQLFPDEQMGPILEAIETRNISVHNRCVINQRYIKRTGSDESLLGQLRELSTEDVEYLVPLLAKAVGRLDKDARKKLKLRASTFDPQELLGEERIPGSGWLI